MSRREGKSTLKFFFEILIWHLKSSQILVQIFNSYFDFHGEYSNIQSQNLYYTIQALCVMCFQAHVKTSG